MRIVHRRRESRVFYHRRPSVHKTGYNPGKRWGESKVCGRYIITADLGSIFVRFGLKDEAMDYRVLDYIQVEQLS